MDGARSSRGAFGTEVSAPRGDVAGLVQALQSRFGSARVRVGVPLASWTTFRVGGPADVVFEPGQRDELRLAVDEARRTGVPVTILGGGSNVLVADRGVRGLVVRLTLRRIESCGPSQVRAEAGATINGLVRWTMARGLGGLEAWAGTPGTVGGAVCGNAHFGGRLIADLIDRVEAINPDGEFVSYARADAGFSYDRSRFQTTGEIVVAVLFQLRPGCAPEVLRARARESLGLRKRTQPLGAPSAGCVFRNPVPGDGPMPPAVPASAGALIDRAGLKGTRVGGAVVSPVHANFIVAEPGARAADVRALIEHCRTVVRQRYGVELREEIRFLGDFGEN